VAEIMRCISIKFGIRWSDRTHLPYYDAPVLSDFGKWTSENNLCGNDYCSSFRQAAQ